MVLGLRRRHLVRADDSKDLLEVGRVVRVVHSHCRGVAVVVLVCRHVKVVQRREVVRRLRGRQLVRDGVRVNSGEAVVGQRVRHVLVHPRVRLRDVLREVGCHGEGEPGEVVIEVVLDVVVAGRRRDDVRDGARLHVRLALARDVALERGEARAARRVEARGLVGRARAVVATVAGREVAHLRLRKLGRVGARALVAAHAVHAALLARHSEATAAVGLALAVARVGRHTLVVRERERAIHALHHHAGRTASRVREVQDLVDLVPVDALQHRAVAVPEASGAEVEVAAELSRSERVHAAAAQYVAD
mmetsp:Transcript_15940/g.55577  ORF Transcript_15940/g.55577 Transcript_15940/m.55577 type:complete len:305 (+) Transcript_15940:7166-8080(+)